MGEKTLQANVEALREFIQSKGWSISAETEIAHGYQLVVTDGANKTPINLFTTGKMLIQGRPNALQAELRSWANERRATSISLSTSSEPAASQTTAPTASKPEPGTGVTSTAGKARIGSDESGKGDYFGPLVVAAVYVDGQTEPRLIDLGVCDSKLLPDHRILEMAEIIGQMCPHSVVSLGPKTYNEMYAQMQNLNQLLAWGHARCLERVLEKVTCDLAIADQFGNESYLRNALGERGRQIRLEQHPHAESDMAVAAASILARAEFVRKMEQLSRQVGKKLPKGAFDPSIITIGREIVARGGEAALAEVAKVHFKITQKILEHE
jgi:ribonuclease HIII